MRGVKPSSAKEAKDKMQLKPFEPCKATLPKIRFEWDAGLTTLLLPWIADTEMLRIGNTLVMVFGNVEVTLHRKRREAEKAGWKMEELLDLLQDQKIKKLRDDPELGCSLQAFRLERNADGETERHPLTEIYEETGLGMVEDDANESASGGPGEETP